MSSSGIWFYSFPESEWLPTLPLPAAVREEFQEISVEEAEEAEEPERYQGLAMRLIARGADYSGLSESDAELFDEIVSGVACLFEPRSPDSLDPEIVHKLFERLTAPQKLGFFRRITSGRSPEVREPVLLPYLVVGRRPDGSTPVQDARYAIFPSAEVPALLAEIRKGLAIRPRYPDDLSHEEAEEFLVEPLAQTIRSAHCLMMRIA